MSKSTAVRRLYTPRTSRRYSPRLDPETVGQITESIARFFGTGRYLLLQTIVVAVWIVVNVFAVRLRWDPYPFILLNLAFSTQAAYAAPLILLAQNRQENRDRVALEEDRRRAAQTKADTEYLARELAAVRLAVGEVVTREYLRHELDDLRELLAELRPQSADGERFPAPTTGSRRLRNPGENRSNHCATRVTRVMYGDLVHRANRK
ncbi:membrane protein [Mycobacterium avium 09-5983]|nr:membrane protein [Mycobacterium avium 09-5983]